MLSRILSLYSIPIDHGELYYIEDFLNTTQANQLLQTLLHEVSWQQHIISLFGKKHKSPRLSAWQSDHNIHYRYSGLTLTSTPWHPLVLALKQQLVNLTQQPFNSVLLNYYRHGQDSMGWHSDNEKSLGSEPIIASVSVGDRRRFSLRPIPSTTPRVKDNRHIVLEPGSLLVMAGSLQHHWQHSLAKTKKSQLPRINLTFRNVIKSAAI